MSTSQTSEVTRKKMSKGQMSIASHASAKKIKNKALEREEQISKGIQKVFEDRKEKMIKSIIETMDGNKYKQYRQFRKDQGFEAQINELEKERQKHKRKKNKKERKKLLYRNTLDKFQIVVRILQMCFSHYKETYYESD